MIQLQALNLILDTQDVSLLTFNNLKLSAFPEPALFQPNAPFDVLFIIARVVTAPVVPLEITA